MRAPSTFWPAAADAISSLPVPVGLHSTATSPPLACRAAEQIAQPTARESLWVASWRATSLTASRFLARVSEAAVVARSRRAR